jgi:hypothetical protein
MQANEGGRMSKAQTENYNGWKNYPTWAVNLWLSNDEGLYYATREIAAQALKETSEDNPGDATGILAANLKDWVTDDLTPDLGATFAADLLGYALACVDWYEIAEAWLEKQ